MPFNTYRPDLMGRAEIDVDHPLTVGDWATVTLSYTAGKFGIDDGGGLKISFRSATDQTRFQFDDPRAPGYVSVATSNGTRVKTWFESNRNIRPWHHTLYIQCHSYLKEGDTITVVFGDRSGGSRGYRLQTFCEKAFQFRVHVDAFATYDYALLPEDKQPCVALVAGPPARWKMVLPTLRRINEPFFLGIKAEDRWGNPTDQVAQTLRLEASAPVEGLPDTVTLDASHSVERLEGLRVFTPGDLTITAYDEKGGVVARSNPLRISADAPFVHYWSDMHGQSGETVGTNPARDYFAFARDKAFVDIAGHQGNDFQITDTFWRELNDLTAEFDEPGRFLAIPGYEWSGNTSVGGDHNIWYRNEGGPIYRAHGYLVGEDCDPAAEAHTAVELFERLRDEDVLVVAHVGGRYADISYAHDNELEPSVEVHSAWGTFDWIVDQAFDENYRVGIVAASDGHKGRPGASYPGASKFGSYGGLTCHLMERLDRDALFAAFRARHHYATTGCRALIDVSLPLSSGRIQGTTGWEPLQGAVMGDIVRCGNDSFRLGVEVSGSSGVERIELRDGTDVLETFKPHRAASEDGRRIRVICEGAEYKGRGRLVNWNAGVRVHGNTIVEARPVNFWNPDALPTVAPDQVQWKNVTTGGWHAVDLFLASGSDGWLEIRTSQGNVSAHVADVTADDVTFPLGGLGKAIRLLRLPGESLPPTIEHTFDVPRVPGKEHRLYIKTVFEDGHMAWTSPIYVLKD